MKVSEIPFDEEGVDRPWWKGQSDGVFSIKSAWNLVRTSVIQRPLLSNLWHPTIMVSMSIFAWRLLHNFIPVDERLKEKGMVTVFKCFCCENIESLQHLFLNNPALQEVWYYFASAFIRRVMGYLWRLYKAKGFKPVHWRGDLSVVNRLGFNFYSASLANPILCRWLPPPHGIWKLNCDGASNGNPGSSGAGGIIRDSRGKMILAFYDFFGAHTNTFAELYAINRGLHLGGRMVAVVSGWNWMLVQYFG
ncbi:UNVERIFIED_CONTAM: hypothetical protein Sradi_2550200 [Sesamum radiatum]|uniref:RNase H type-1 domain-containing protein n=1 Tax=Sesamum radiatum TaxID=300843 RepID=A0AAW2SMC0_SESRA